MSDVPAPIIEAFSSVQGEGPLVGVRQIFLRFSGCNLDCTYCDTDREEIPKDALLETTPGRRDFRKVPNPVSCHQVTDLLRKWHSRWPTLHHSLSLTGGEPLLHIKLLRQWLPLLRQLFPIYLETNGSLPDALSQVISFCDHISMDIKLPSSSGCSDLWNEHQAFLSIASAKNVFVKAVVGEETEPWEIARTCQVISAVDRKIPLILQPLTLQNGAIGISPLQALAFQEAASAYLQEVRIIPQTHKFMEQL